QTRKHLRLLTKPTVTSITAWSLMKNSLKTQSLMQNQTHLGEMNQMRSWPGRMNMILSTPHQHNPQLPNPMKGTQTTLQIGTLAAIIRLENKRTLTPLIRQARPCLFAMNRANQATIRLLIKCYCTCQSYCVYCLAFA